ncbi:MAG: MBOAT family O-acyltransferase [Acutalibacteraceae bacterium]|nr:MBOAT family O-acyltransferase [Acutalibacteraceae bacterium]
MVFSSTVFLFLFFPVTYVLYLIIPSIRAKNILLIITSLLFYAFGEPITVFLMIFSVAVNYALGLAIAKAKSSGKPFLVMSVVFNLALLCIFKYTMFFTELLNSVLPIDITVPNIRLPIGISFFTFQILSYVIDVYKDKSLVQKNFLNVLLYISLFPQLIAGPIVKYYDIAKQIENREITAQNTALGIRRFICGLSKKILIANTVGSAADAMFSLSGSDLSILTCWLGGIAYTIQIYFDFSGYSDMAIGLGRMLGFTFKENFNYPYTSSSMQDFWRRWHISISSWFKEYLYIPLGGNRKGRLRTAVNKIIVFFFTGLWHGANLTFVVWGLVHGMFLMLESYKVIPLEKIKFKPIKHIYTMLVVIVTFVIFRADNLTQAWLFIKNMFTGFNISGESLSIFCEQFTPYFIFILILGIIFSMPVVQKLSSKPKTEKAVTALEYLSYGATLSLLFMCITALASSTFNPFIYLQF